MKKGVTCVSSSGGIIIIIIRLSPLLTLPLLESDTRVLYTVVVVRQNDKMQQN
jgi:hypothetical protein